MILWLLTTLVATCGQKGPLYLPEENPEKSPEATTIATSNGRLIPHPSP